MDQQTVRLNRACFYCFFILDDWYDRMQVDPGYTSDEEVGYGSLSKPGKGAFFELCNLFIITCANIYVSDYIRLLSSTCSPHHWPTVVLPYACIDNVFTAFCGLISNAIGHVAICNAKEIDCKIRNKCLENVSIPAYLKAKRCHEGSTLQSPLYQFPGFVFKAGIQRENFHNIKGICIYSFIFKTSYTNS